MPAAPVPVARISRPHGVRGELHILLYGSGEILEGAESVLLAGRTHRILLFRRAPDPRRALLRLEGVNGRDEAEALRGLELSLPAGAFPPPEEGEYWHHELVGRPVVDLGAAAADGGRGASPAAAHASPARVLGIVVAVENYGASDLLVVRGEAGEWLVPIVEGVVLSTGPDRVEVALPEGLEPSP